MRSLTRRVRRQFVLAVVAAAVGGIVYWWAVGDDTVFAWSMATGYAALVLLAVALVLGPWRVLRGGAPSVHTELRRDVGIWGGVLGVVHVVFGLQAHMRGRPWLYFVPEPEAGAPLPVRTDLFGFANHTGLAATLLLLVLLALSNDRALRRLGADRWKWWQRLNYVGMALVALHALAYQLIEKRAAWLVVVLLLLTAGSGALQLAGRRRVLSGRRAQAGGAQEPRVAT